MADLGKVGPVHGRWVWPFRQMEIGDEFHVRYEDRDPEDVRHMGSVRAAQLGMRLSCTKDDAAGVMRVARVPYRVDEEMLPKDLSYEQMNALLRRQYNLEADDVPWHGLSRKGDQVWKEAVRIEPDARSVVRVDVGRQRVEVELRADGLLATLLNEVPISKELEEMLAKAEQSSSFTFPCSKPTLNEEMARLME